MTAQAPGLPPLGLSPVEQDRADASHYGCTRCRGWDEHTDACPVWRAIDAESRRATRTAS